MGPYAAGLPVYHNQDRLLQPKDLERKRSALNHGVEPDPRAALDSIGDQQGPTSNVVVDNVMIGEHSDWISAGFTHPL